MAKNIQVDWKRELIGGVTTFFTMAYIVIVNPSILSTPGTGIPFSGALTATVVLAFSMTLLMGLYAKLPFAVAPGMGINAFFTFSLILGKQVAWPVALGLVFWAGVLFLILSILPVRTQIAEAIPKSLREASAVGIGLFLTFIGLRNAGLVVGDPVTFVRANVMNRSLFFSILGLALTAILVRKKNPFAFLAGIAGVTFVSFICGDIRLPAALLSRPDFNSVFFKLDIWGAFQLALLPAIASICFTDLFDSISTFIGVSQATGLVDDQGRPKNLKQGLIVDAFATLGAGLVGTSSGTAYIESSAGIEAGGRTGLSSVFTALCFLPCLFIAPLVGLVPAYATAPVLILVGAMMFRNVANLKLREWEDLLPAYLTIILIPLTFSITQGMLWGFIAHVLLYVAVGRRKEVDSFMYGIAAISVGMLAVEYYSR